MLRKLKSVVWVEWPTFFLLVACYAVWALATGWVSAISLPVGFAITVLMVTLHSSLQHEVLHGHPFRSRCLSEAAVFPALGLCVPYQRFRETHLSHHRDSILTDPYDDPESNYLDPQVWAQLSSVVRALLGFNNTLAGRLIIGPAVSMLAFVRVDIGLIRRGDRQVLKAWLAHFAGVAMVVLWLWHFGKMPVWLYILAAYCGFSILKIRTFLEHRAHDQASGRTVVVEDKGPLAWLFLNNNLHLVHHMHPAMPWYRLPGLYAKNKARYLARNDGYIYRSYADVFRRYFLRRKDPVPHPLWRR